MAVNGVGLLLDENNWRKRVKVNSSLMSIKSKQSSVSVWLRMVEKKE